LQLGEALGGQILEGASGRVDGQADPDGDLARRLPDVGQGAPRLEAQFGDRVPADLFDELARPLTVGADEEEPGEQLAQGV
jgi:hypothetical protein